MKIAEIKDWLQVIAIVSGGVWAIWTFGLKNEREDIIYRGMAVAAVPSCSLQVVGKSRGFYLIKARSGLVSNSKIKVHVFHSPYVFLGTFAAPHEKIPPLPEFMREVNQKMLASERFAHAQLYANPTGVPIEMGRLWSAVIFLEPGEKIEDERLFLVSEKNAQQFDWVTFAFGLVVAKDISRLGLKVELDVLGNLRGEYRVYKNVKKNPYSLEDDSRNPYTSIPVKADDVSPNSEATRLADASEASVSCSMILPPKSLQGGSATTG